MLDVTTCAQWADEYCTQKYYQLALKFAQDMIKIKSENPPGDELEVSQYCSKTLRNAGFSVIWDEFSHKRCNVVATIGDESDIGIILNGHLDVVPVSGEWKYPPYEAFIDDGRLYGRGSADMKSGCAAMMAAAICLYENGVINRGLKLVLNSDEEYLNLGIRRLLSKEKLSADVTLIGEPTELNICLGNKGYASYYVKMQGLSCHASSPEKGENAIYKMGDVINRLEEYAEKVRKEIVHKELGAASLSVGMISGGIQVNTVPDSCTLTLERRILPGETRAQVLESIQKAVGDNAKVALRSWMDAGWLEKEHPFVDNVYDAASYVTKKQPTVDKFNAGTESSFFSVDCMIPTIILGPGSLNQAHKIDEFIDIKQIDEAVKIYTIITKMYVS